MVVAGLAVVLSVVLAVDGTHEKDDRNVRFQSMAEI